MSQADDAFIELSQLTGLTRQKLEDFLSLPPDLQALTAAEWRDQDWSDPATPAGKRALAALMLLGSIAGVVGGVAGATGAVKALFGH